jgi:hypothetical protein
MLMLGAVGRVHPLHTTHTELHEEAPGVVRIQVRAFSDDLSAAVRGREPAADDSSTARYVRSVLELRRLDGRLVPLEWIGIRPVGEISLIALRARIPGRVQDMTIRQAMHLERFPDQVNVVRAVYAGRRITLVFVAGDAPRRLP